MADEREESEKEESEKEESEEEIDEEEAEVKGILDRTRDTHERLWDLVKMAGRSRDRLLERSHDEEEDWKTLLKELQEFERCLDRAEKALDHI